MRNIQDIQAEAFKKGTIYSAFRKARMWPISCKTALKKIKIYTLPKPLEPELPLLP